MHIQRTKNSCGPDCVGTIASYFGISQALVDSAFGVSDIQDFSDIHDSPAHHEAAFSRLNLSFKIRTCHEIMSGFCRPGYVEVLLHAIDDPATIKPESWTVQHWAIVEYVNVIEGFVFLDMGTLNLIPKKMSFSDFQKRYSEGGPTATAYEITGIGKVKQSWYSKLWTRITKKIK